MNEIVEQIPNELYAKVKNGDIEATFELAEILFREKEYHLARIYYLTVSNHGVPAAFDRLKEIDYLLGYPGQSKNWLDMKEEIIKEVQQEQQEQQETEKDESDQSSQSK
ncbi:MAG TPA: hypothetical protein DIC51_03280 [Coxiellaceae bacterium]|nr:hypothetical protein [Coxiellaceae bacterium]